MNLKLDHFGLLAPFYERFIPPAYPARLIELAELPESGLVLDAGGGTGRVAQHLAGPQRQVLVADESLKMLGQASQKPSLWALGAHTEAAPFPDACFDRILMVDALHHVASQAVTAREFWRILKPGGRIVIEEPDRRAFSVKLIAAAEKLALMRSHFLTPQQIASLFPFPGAAPRIETASATAWVIVDKNQ